MLEQLCAKLNLRGALLATFDGQPVASWFDDGLELHDVFQVTALIIQLFTDLAEKCQYACPEMMMMEGAEGKTDKIICLPVKTGGQILFLFAKDNVNMGMIRLMLQDALEEPPSGPDGGST